jgi:hypothetical protein
MAEIHDSSTSELRTMVAKVGGMVISVIRLESGFSIFWRMSTIVKKTSGRKYPAAFKFIV